MAVRILNPVISELCKLPACPTMVSRSLSCSQQTQRIKRDLFGQANTTETNRIFIEELEKQQELANKKWGFDFRTGTPLQVNSQYIWQRVSCQEFSYAPQQYTLTRAAHVRPSCATPATPSPMEVLMDERAERENFISICSPTDTDSCDESQDESTGVVFKMPAAVATSNRNCSDNRSATHKTASVARTQLILRKRQPKITEYMKERKRLAQTPKKCSPPNKRMRTSSGGSSSNSNSSSSSSSNRKLHFGL